jgi:flavodoxin
MNLQNLNKELGMKTHSLSNWSKIAGCVLGILLMNVVSLYAQNNMGPATLILFYSKTGNTRAVCQALQKPLNADIIEIKDVSKAPPKKGEKPDIQPKSVDMSAYSSIIIGAPTWGPMPVPVIRAFLQNNKLNRKKVVILTTTNVPMPDQFTAGNKNLVKNAGGNVLAYYQVAVQEGPKSARINKTKEQFVADALKLIPEIKKELLK